VSAFSSIYKPKPGRFGLNLVIGAVQIGTGGRALTATATVSVSIPKPFRKCQLLNIGINGFTAAAGSGAITAQVFKVVGGNGGTRTALTSTFDLTSGGFTTLDLAFNMAVTGTDPQTIAQKADSFTVDLVAAGTVTTAPQAVLSCLLAVMD
jgi:hypothetical protein